jgi:hypothetical protein
MGLETVTNIADFIRTNPTGSDPISQGDNHIQNIKIALTNDFAGFVGAVLITGVDGGAVNAYTLTPSQALTAYANKMLVEFTPTIDCTGACTLNISGLGAKPIITQAGLALTAGDLVSNRAYLVAYDGTSFRLISVTSAYVDAVRTYATGLAFSTALPAQGGNADKFVTTDGAIASWSALLKATVMRFKDGADATKLMAFDLSGITTATTRTVAMPNKNGTMAMTSDIGMVLLATLTPTVAANVDFLSTFSSTYDSYLIIGEGILPSADDTLIMYCAAAGVADTGTNYYRNNVETATPVTVSAQSSLLSPAAVYTSGKGISFALHVINANDATNLKSIIGKSTSQSAVTPAFVLAGINTAYVAANAVSGVRFSWTSAANFKASGKIRVYGIANT